MPDLLTKLADIIEARKSADPTDSYVASLYAGGSDAILKKIGEEATEVVLAAKTGGKEEIIHEIADLWFHSLILLAYQGLRPRRAGSALRPIRTRRKSGPQQTPLTRYFIGGNHYDPDIFCILIDEPGARSCVTAWNTGVFFIKDVMLENERWV